MNQIIVKSTSFSQVCQLLLLLIVFGGHVPKFTNFLYQLGLMVSLNQIEMNICKKYYLCSVFKTIFLFLPLVVLV